MKKPDSETHVALFNEPAQKKRKDLVNQELICLSFGRICTFLLGMMLLSLQPASVLAEEKTMTIGTGNVTGVYYGVGSAVAKMHNEKRKEFGTWMLNQATEGSEYNIVGVLKKDFDFGLAQANFLYYALRGEWLWDNKPQEDLRAVMALHTESLTLLAAVDSGIAKPIDLKGKRVNIGAPGSSDQQTSVPVMEHLGLNLETDTVVSRFPTYLASEKIQSRRIDAYFFTVGHPNLSVIEAAAGQRKIRIVPFSNEFIDFLEKQEPYVTRSEVDVHYYENLKNDSPVSTVGLKAILFTRADVDNQSVYRVVKQVVENFDLFRRQHPALADLTVKDLVSKAVLPLHPGAERYFTEAGIIQ